MKIFHYCLLGLGEYSRSFKLKDAWLYLGIQDIKLRYRRSILGPWWVTISSAIMIIALGFLWSNIFVTDIKVYLPFFAIGYIFWIWISTQITDATTGFTQFENVIKQTDLPFPIYVLRLSVRNIIILSHNLIIVVLVIFIVGDGVNLNTLLVIPAIVLMQVMLILLCTCIAIFCTRFRDMNQVIAMVLQISFFFSPIIWQPSSLKGHYALINWNPIFHWIEIIRQPLLGLQPAIENWEFVLINTGLMFFISVYSLGRLKSKIAIWL